MKPAVELRARLVDRILKRQDPHYRWGFDEQLARERPEYAHYWPKYKSTLWTLLLLADLKAPVDEARILHSLSFIEDHFYNEDQGAFTLGRDPAPIPCLNGNLLYLHFYFKQPTTEKIDRVIDFFDTYQRFDDGDFRPLKTYPYSRCTSCYGKHTCYWGVTKLMKGLSFIPAAQRTANAARLLDNCTAFILLHEVCFSSHRRDEFLHRSIDKLTLPHYQSDYLEILWILSREGVKDRRMARAAALLKAKMNPNGTWALEKPVHNLITSLGRKGQPNLFITERAREFLDFWDQ